MKKSPFGHLFTPWFWSFLNSPFIHHGHHKDSLAGGQGSHMCLIMMSSSLALRSVIAHFSTAMRGWIQAWLLVNLILAPIIVKEGRAEASPGRCWHPNQIFSQFITGIAMNGMLQTIGMNMVGNVRLILNLRMLDQMAYIGHVFAVTMILHKITTFSSISSPNKISINFFLQVRSILLFLKISLKRTSKFLLLQHSSARPVGIWASWDACAAISWLIPLPSLPITRINWSVWGSLFGQWKLLKASLRELLDECSPSSNSSSRSSFQIGIWKWLPTAWIEGSWTV